MTGQPEALRRLIDLPGVDALEYRAILKRDFAEPQARAEFPEIDACVKALFGLTADEAEDVPRPEGWDEIDCKAPAVQVAAFEAAGWDVTDNKRRPLRVLATSAGRCGWRCAAWPDRCRFSRRAANPRPGPRSWRPKPSVSANAERRLDRRKNIFDRFDENNRFYIWAARALAVLRIGLQAA